MTEENRSAKVGESAENSAIITGDRSTATITITNYYYREPPKDKTVESTDAGDENLACPYRGLFHFGPDDAEFFFGREVFVEELFAATQTRNFIPVLGASGSGKSSVVLAGLVPRLQQEGHWLFTHFRPGEGDDPFHALALALVPLLMPKLFGDDKLKETCKIAESLRNKVYPLSYVFTEIQHNYPKERVLLIADQFEEIYTLCADRKIRDSFLDTLLASFQSSPSQSQYNNVLVATMRADFLGNALSYPPFADRLRNVDIKIRSMNREELSEVIEKPADRLGVTFEAGLVERILNDVEDQPGNLPLLEFALTELWNKRTGKQLTHEIYEEVGRVEGALARHADKKYSNLTDEEKDKVRRIFIQLVRPGEGREDTRRIAVKEELGEQSWSLIKQLADARLVVTSRNATSQKTVEVVHEALIRNWGELREWMNTDRVFRGWQERLRVLKREWEDKKEDRGSLLRGAALAEAEEKLKERPEELIAEQAFIEQSIQERDRIEQEEKERQQRELEAAQKLVQAQTEARQAAEQREAEQKEANKKLRLGAIFLTAVSLIALGTAGWAWKQTKQAQLNLADSLARTSLSLLAEGKDLDAFLEAIRAGKILQKRQAKDPEVMGALIANIYEGSERNRLQGHDGSVRSVSLSEDGQTLVSGSADNTIKVWNLETRAEIRTLRGHDDSVRSVSVSEDGQTLVSGSADNTIKVWNLETGAEIRTLTGHDDWVRSVSVSEDGQTLVSGSADNTIKVWNLETRAEIRTLRGHDDSVRSVSVSEDGQTLVSGSLDNTIKVWNLDFDWLMGRSCDWVRNYLQYNPNIQKEDRRLCDGIGTIQ